MNRKIEFFDHAIVFNVRPRGDRDLIVKFLTPSYGMLDSFAFGARNSKRRFSGCFEELSHVVFKVKSPRHGNYLFLEEGILLERFSNIHKSKERYGIAKNCQKFIEALVLEKKEAKKVYSLFLGMLKMLDKEGPISKNYPIFFRAKIAKEIGYMIDLHICSRCRRWLLDENEIFFFPEKGKVFCKRCVTGSNGYLCLDRWEFDVLKGILSKDTENWNLCFHFFEKENKIAKCLGRFVESHLNIKWDRGRFVSI